MEINEDGFLEELLSLGSRETWDMSTTTSMTITNNPPELMNSFFCNSWVFDAFDTNPSSSSASSILPTSYDCFSSTSFTNNTTNKPTSLVDCSFNEFYSPIFEPKFSTPSELINVSPSFNTATTKLQPQPFTTPDGGYSMSVVEDEEPSVPLLVDPNHNNTNNNVNLSVNTAQGLEIRGGEACKLEGEQQSLNISPAVFNIGSTTSSLCVMERKSNGSKVKKIEGQPSKNLMAERRRRKRLNDRLSMLRSVVPKISKMDRTSILGDTIDYMKELLERISNLQEEIDVSSSELKGMSIIKDHKQNDTLVRNSPKFDVERRDMDTRVEICCSGKPGLLLSTVTTLEALGMEIQQCVISCFNDFSLNASCSEGMEQRSLLSSEDIKQALFRNAGYGGRCL